MEGSTASITSAVDMKYPYAQSERCPLDLMSEMGSQRCFFLTLSKSHGGVHNSGTVDEWLGGIQGGLVAMLI